MHWAPEFVRSMRSNSADGIRRHRHNRSAISAPFRNPRHRARRPDPPWCPPGDTWPCRHCDCPARGRAKPPSASRYAHFPQALITFVGHRGSRRTGTIPARHCLLVRLAAALASRVALALAAALGGLLGTNAGLASAIGAQAAIALGDSRLDRRHGDLLGLGC